jgi:hypothetical protein
MIYAIIISMSMSMSVLQYCDACLRRSYNISVNGLTAAEQKNWVCPAVCINTFTLTFTYTSKHTISVS